MCVRVFFKMLSCNFSNDFFSLFERVTLLKPVVWTKFRFKKILIYDNQLIIYASRKKKRGLRLVAGTEGCNTARTACNTR